MLLFAYKLIISTQIFKFWFFLPSYNPFKDSPTINKSVFNDGINIFSDSVEPIVYSGSTYAPVQQISLDWYIYYIFLLRFGLANAINNYIMLKISVVCVESFNLNCLLVEFLMPNLSQIYFCIQEIFYRNV